MGNKSTRNRSIHLKDNKHGDVQTTKKIKNHSNTPLMKRIVIDFYPVSLPYVGFGEFCRQIGERLGKRAAELRSRHGIELFFILPPKFRGCFGNEVHYICMPKSFRRLLALYPIQADLFHIPYQNSRTKRLPLAKKQLLTVHDINFIYEKKGKKLKRAADRFRKIMGQSDYVNYISKFAYEDVKKHFHAPQPGRVIYNGVTDLSALSRQASLPASLPDEFLFHISSLRRKKNVHLLLEMMEYLPEQNLLIAGDWDSDYGRMLQQRINESGSHNIYVLPNVTESEKAALYAACRALLFPSMCEGFGLPPIEAMKLGKPVFLSTLTSLPEIGGKEAFYWDDLSPKAMAEVVRKQLAVFDESPAYAEKLRQNAARFDWDDCVEQYIKFYIEIIGS